MNRFNSKRIIRVRAGCLQRDYGFTWDIKDSYSHDCEVNVIFRNIGKSIVCMFRDVKII